MPPAEPSICLDFGINCHIWYDPRLKESSFFYLFAKTTPTFYTLLTSNLFYFWVTILRKGQLKFDDYFYKNLIFKENCCLKIRLNFWPFFSPFACSQKLACLKIKILWWNFLWEYLDPKWRLSSYFQSLWSPPSTKFRFSKKCLKVQF